jgi:cytochrome c-type biogenesis protein CcmH/NrfG
MTDAKTDTGRERLEAERDFLLRSLDDLEAEHDSDGIDDESYQRLHDDYTARAAAVIRSLRDGVRDTPRGGEAPGGRRRVLLIGAVVVFGMLTGVALASALGARLPGQTSSGNTGSRTGTAAPGATVRQRRQQLEAAVARNPQDVASRLLLAEFLEAENNPAGALQQYDAVVKLDPSNAIAEAQAGRILYLTAQAAPASQAADLVNRARARLDHAILLNPQYADAHFFRAIILAQEFQAFTDAQNDLQHYLVLAPNGMFADQARQLLAQVENALTTGTSPTTTSPNRKVKP